MNIYGLDFTSAPGRKKPITCAICELTQDTEYPSLKSNDYMKPSVGAGVDVVGGEDPCVAKHAAGARPSLKLIECLKLNTFAEFEDFLRRDGPWLAALDFPFGQPRKLITDLDWPDTWAGYIQMIASMGKQSFEDALLQYCASKPAGEKHALRKTDIYARARSPMMLYRVPVAKMFFQGPSRLLASGVSILPCRPTHDNRIVIEGYPALVARRWIGSCSYKSDEHTKQTVDKTAARQRILSGLCSNSHDKSESYNCTMEISEAQVESLVEDATGDCLDALLCAIQAAWAYSQRDDGYGIPRDCDSLEGWIVNPATLLGTPR